MLIEAERDDRVHRLRLYEDRDGSRTFTAGDLLRLDRGGEPAVHGPRASGLVTIERCCLDFDGGGPAMTGSSSSASRPTAWSWPRSTSAARRPTAALARAAAAESLSVPRPLPPPPRPSMPIALALSAALVPLAAGSLAAQQPDTTATDSVSVLPEIEVVGIDPPARRAQGPVGRAGPDQHDHQRGARGLGAAGRLGPARHPAGHVRSTTTWGARSRPASPPAASTRARSSGCRRASRSSSTACR